MRPLLTLALLSIASSVYAQDIVTLHTPSAATDVMFSRDGKIVAAGCRDNKFRVWKLPAQEPAITLDTSAAELVGGDLSRDGLWIVAGDRNGTYSVWDTRTGKRQWEYKSPFYASAIAFDGTGRRLAIAPSNQAVQIFDVMSGKKLVDLPSVVAGTQYIAFSPDGTRLATADSDTAVRIYDSASGKLLSTYSGFVLEPLAVAFSGDGRQVLAGGGDQFIAVIDPATGQLLRKSVKLTDPVSGFEMTPDGKTVAVRLLHAADMSVRLPIKMFDLGSTRELREWQPPKGTLGSQWTSDEHLVVASAAENGIRISRAF